MNILMYILKGMDMVREGRKPGGISKRFVVDIYDEHLFNIADNIRNNQGWTLWIKQRLLEEKEGKPMTLEEAQEKQFQVELSLKESQSAYDLYSEYVKKLQMTEVERKVKELQESEKNRTEQEQRDRESREKSVANAIIYFLEWFKVSPLIAEQLVNEFYQNKLEIISQPGYKGQKKYFEQRLQELKDT